MVSEIKEAIDILKSCGVNDYSTKYDKAYRIAIKCMETIYDAKLTNGWILVSERLPTMEECQKNDCRFIVTDGNRRYQSWFDYEDNYFEKCDCNGCGLKKDNCVIAWQTLPEPYKETNL